MSKDLCVRDLVLPLDVEKSAEAGCVEVIQLPGVTLIHYPRVTGIKQRYLSTLRFMSASDPAFWAQSSANRKSLMMSVMNLDFA